MTIQQLENLITRAATAYYSGQPIMSDVQFDRYVAWLEALDPKSEVLHKTGWGYTPSTSPGDKVRHTHGGMQSIDRKPRDTKDIPDHLKYDVRISAKLDGLSGKIEFVDGKFTRCVTRGSGEEGIDKTDKFNELLTRYSGTNLPDNFTGEIRGEFVISQANWNKMLENGTHFKNSRNAASGIINCDTIPEEIEFLDFVPYKVIWDQNNVFSHKVVDLMGDCEFCKYLPNFPQVPKAYMSKYYTSDDLITMYEGWNEIWPCDGVVITKNDIKVSQDGIRNYDEVAFKFETLKAVTTVESIDWQISRQSTLIPVANVTPVDIDGATISRVTLHNAAFVQASDIKIGSEIEIMRSGGVIPKFMSLVSSPESVESPLPKTCPECGNELEWSGVHLKCTSSGCGNVDYQTLRVWFNFIGRIDGIAETTAFEYFNRFKIETVSDIYSKDPEVFEALRAESITSAKFADVMAKMYSGKHTLVNALQALNIPRVGEVTAKKLSSNNSAVELFKKAITEIAEGHFENTTRTDLCTAIRQVAGDATYSSFSQNLDKLFELWGYIASNIEIPEVTEISAEAIPVVITGKLSMTRKDFEKLLNDAGYVVKEDVTKKTKYLVTNDENGTTGKHKRADELGTEKISEAKMLEILAN